MLCPNCFADIADNASTCPHCGLDIDARRSDYAETWLGQNIIVPLIAYFLLVLTGSEMGFFSVNQTFFQYEFGIFNWFTFPALALIMTFGEARRQWWGGYLSGLTVVCLIWMAFSKVTPNFIQF